MPVLLGVLGLLACGARSSLGERAARGSTRVRDAAVDGAPDDASTGIDAGERPDAVGFDAGRDAGVASCRRDADCERGRCRLSPAFTPSDRAPAPLVCGDDGPGADDGALCDDVDGCARGLCVVAGSCVAPCVDDEDCGPAERCASLYVRTGRAALQTLRGCVARFDVPSGVDVTRTSLGTRRGSTVLEIAGVRGRTFEVYETSGASLLPTSLRTRGASPQVLFDLARLGPGAAAPRNPIAPFVLPVTVLLPNSPASVVASEGYEMAVEVGAPTEIVVSRLQRSEGAGRVLDLDLFYVGGAGLAPASERGPPSVREALGEAETLLGIRFGEVRQHEVVGGLRRQLAILEADAEEELPELPELFALSAGAGRPSVAVFFVRDMEVALGVSGGVPGPWGMHGLAGSGIALSLDVLDDYGLRIGDVLAHELGHFLGLFHTTESDGTVLEPLPMTPSCPLDRDLDGDLMLLPEECAEFDGSNLMFWAGVGRRLLPQQRALIRAAFVLR